MKIKKITISAVLTAISIIIPMICPKVVLPLFTATLMAHVPIMIAICISTDVAVMVTIGTSVGFAFAYSSMPLGYVRSFTHIFFVIIACYLLNKKINIFIIIVLSGIIHAISETIVICFLFLPESQNNPSVILFISLCLCAFLHHIIDSICTSFLVIPLKKVKLIKRNFNVKKFKE